MKGVVVLLVILHGVCSCYSVITRIPRIKVTQLLGFHYPSTILRLRPSDFTPLEQNSEMQLYLKNNIDSHLNPCDNFYEYVCGKYRRQSIPEDKESINHFESLADLVTRNLHHFVSTTFKNREWRTVKSFVHVQNLFRSCMNRDTLRHLGIGRIAEQIKTLGGWPLVEKEHWNETQFDWITFTYKMRNLGLKWNHFLNIYVDIDRNNSISRIVWIDEGANYFSSVALLAGMDSRMVQRYMEYQVDISIYFNSTRMRAKQEFQDAMQFAIKIAKIQMTPAEKRDITNLTNKYTIEELSKRFPFVPWLEYINTLFEGWATLTKDDVVNVPSTTFLYELAKILDETPKRTVANYLMWFVLKQSVPYLVDYIKKKVNVLNADVNGGVNMNGPLWKECLDTVTIALPLQVNAMYAWYLKETGKKRKYEAEQLMNHIRNATKNYLMENYWMDEQTRTKAVEKLDAMRFYVAYPDEVFNKTLLDDIYVNLTMDPSEFYINMMVATRADIEREIKLLRQPINKTDWIVHTWTTEINAGYSPDENSIKVSAGILQGVFFNMDQPRALNYGSLGFIVGHEITHGFDDMGRHFDKDGQLTPWWGNNTEANFNMKYHCVKELNSRTVIRQSDGTEYRLNGLLTQGETMSDIGGIKLAYHAFLESNIQLGPENQKHSLSEKFSKAQLFWLSAAATWCSKTRPLPVEEYKTTRSHPPDEYRVNAAVSNNIEFARDFKCPLGSPMNPYNKCTIW